MLCNNVRRHAKLALPHISYEIRIYITTNCFRNLELQYCAIKLYLCDIRQCGIIFFLHFIRYQYLKHKTQSPFEDPEQNNLYELNKILKSV